MFLCSAVHLLYLLSLLRHGVENVEDEWKVRVVHLLLVCIAGILHHGIDGAHLAGECVAKRVAVSAVREE